MLSQPPSCIAVRRPLTLAAAVLLSALGAGCSSPGAEAAAPPKIGETRELDGGWFETHPEPNLVLRLRKGWSANRAEGGVGPINFVGPNGARVMVWPMFVDRRMRMPAQYSILTGFARAAAPQFRWSQPGPFGRNGERMFGQSRDAVAQASFTYENTPAGLVGVWYLTAAAPADYEALRPVFAGLMGGVKIYGSGGGAGAGAGASAAGRTSQAAAQAAAQALQFVRWTEPNEGAYTAEVPRGWRIAGGVIRPDPLRLFDPVEMTSPDGKVYAFSGDRNLALYKTPTQLEASAGMREGMRNGVAVLRRYVPAVQLLPEYLQQRFGRACPQLQIVRADDLRAVAEDANRQLAATANATGMSQRVDVAIAQVRCSADAVGLVQLVTYVGGLDPRMTGGEPTAMWQIFSVGGFMAPESRAAEAGQAVLRLLTSRKVNPQWAQGNQAMVASINNISQQSSAQISRMIEERYRITSSTQVGSGQIGASDELVRQRENAMLDTTDVVDPRTGENYKVASGSNYYWVNPQGTVVGTNAPSLPATDFQAMTERP